MQYLAPPSNYLVEEVLKSVIGDVRCNIPKVIILLEVRTRQVDRVSEVNEGLINGQQTHSAGRHRVLVLKDGVQGSAVRRNWPGIIRSLFALSTHRETTNDFFPIQGRV